MNDTDVEPRMMAIDDQGNPVCPGCGADGIILAARANSGLNGCMCPPDDRRVAGIETLADARERISDAIDHLERAGHPLICRCDACDASHILRTGTL